MINTANSVMGLAYMMDFQLFPSAAEAKAAQMSITRSIEQWLAAFAPMLERKDIDQRGALLLKAQIVLDRIWISRYMQAKTECAFDNYIDDFREIIECMEVVLGDRKNAENGQLPSFTIDTGMIGTLYFTASKCRDRLLRRKAIELITKCPRKEGLFDSVELGKVAEFIMEVEEEHLPPLPNEDKPVEERRVSDYRIETRAKTFPYAQDVYVYHGLASVPDSLLAQRTLTYDELDADNGVKT